MTARSFIHATRSILPSPTANSIQSAYMANAFDARLSAFTSVYRSGNTNEPACAQFAPYGLNPPRHTRAIRTLGWTHLDLLAFRSFFRVQPRDSIVYTRSSRVSWAAISAGLTTFIELHDPLIPIRIAWLKHLLKKGRLPGLIATTQQLKDDLLASLDLAGERILVAGGAASASFLELTATPVTPTHAFNVGYAGSAFRGKGVEILLRCARLMPDTGFHLIGPGRSTCARLGPISPNVIFHGRHSSPVAIGLLKSMDALLLANQRSVIIRSGADIGRHTSPLKLFEYLATGVPIVASDLPIFNGVLQDGANALLTPAEDVDGFCRQLMRLKNEPELARAIGSQAQLDFAARHTWDHRAKNILEFINRLEGA